MDDAIQIFNQRTRYSRLLVMQHVIIRAARALDKIEALALIRGAYVRDDGAHATLDEAKQIYASIMKSG